MFPVFHASSINRATYTNGLPQDSSYTVNIHIYHSLGCAGASKISTDNCKAKSLFTGLHQRHNQKDSSSGAMGGE
ncbi:hypothetical protein CHARACLAT_029121 [Characodon lateralis]|uniref:Uncharacterized protein n=1 Tax=Characodon lateralis TaxID=208331 RepID=A0ABU7E8Q4_9TELE|nr:hypothetical protein [Characodon lateralis]